MVDGDREVLAGHHVFVGRFYWGESDEEPTGGKRARDAVVVFAGLTVAFVVLGWATVLLAAELVWWLLRYLVVHRSLGN